jgi:hypothetical protein
MPNFALRAISRAPGLKRLPILKLLAIGEVVALARNHANKLTPAERRRVLELVKESKGATGKLTDAQRYDLTAHVMKAEPRMFAGNVADSLSPFPLPKRLKYGPRAKRKAAAARAAAAENA